ncbi:hypothetical protein GCM10009665_61580 [Kitasatospora nipponensis]|uniref:Uncharacterized protein n=1 Tax=Kitasatospora nipponensis TaxID=258049 RepID=A0ABN1WW89_9ACTN
MKHRKNGSATTVATTIATVEAGRSRFGELPERIRPEDTFVSVPTATVSPERDTFSHEEWLARNVWCGTLL